MTKKIFINAFLLGASVFVICAILFFALQYAQTSEETYAQLRSEAEYAAEGLRISGPAYFDRLEHVSRITWIAADGSVLYDSGHQELGNQRDCDEIGKAMTAGEGQAVRKEEASGVRTMYYAFRCEDGTVLRLSRPLSIVRYAVHAVSPVLWVFLLVLIISAVMAFRIAKYILKPVNELNLDDPEADTTYPELAPLVHRIQEQKMTIRRETLERESMRKEFSANVSHELKTPLTSISGFAELMRDGLVPDDKVREFAGDIYRESQRMITLVDDIMRLSKLDEETGFPDAENVSLYRAAEEIIRSLRTQAAKRGVTVSLTGEDIEVKGVRQIIQEMLYNLVDNAIKYNRDGGSVTVNVRYEDGRPSFSVADTGIGIPEAEQERVFERFYRVDKSHSKTIGGTGLGLSIVKHGAIYHDAQVRLQSEPDKGTTVTVVF